MNKGRDFVMYVSETKT